MPADALRGAATEAAETLQIAHALLRRPGSGKGRKKQKNVAAEARAAAARAAAAAAASDSAAWDGSDGGLASGGTGGEGREPSIADLTTADADLLEVDLSIGRSAIERSPKPVVSSALAVPSPPAMAVFGEGKSSSDLGDCKPPSGGIAAASLSVVLGAPPDQPPLQARQQASCATPQLRPPPDAAASQAHQPADPPVHLQQLTRLTFATDDPSFATQLDGRPDITAGYDIIAIEPRSERVLQQVHPKIHKLFAMMYILHPLHKLSEVQRSMGPTQACMSLRVDLITFNFTRRLPFRLKPTLLHAAIDRGVHFEVGPAARLCCTEPPQVSHACCLTLSCASETSHGNQAWKGIEKGARMLQICYSFLGNAANRRSIFSNAQVSQLPLPLAAITSTVPVYQIRLIIIAGKGSIDHCCRINHP